MPVIDFNETISNLLFSLDIDFKRVAGQRFGFIVNHTNNKTVAIEARRSNIHASLLSRFRDRFKSDDTSHVFVLVTPETPTRVEKTLFNSVFRDSLKEAHWLGANELASFLGYAESADLSSPETMASLQLAAFTENIKKYSEDHIGLSPEKKSVALPRRKLKARQNKSQKSENQQQKQQVIDPNVIEYQMLSRQFSYATISRFLKRDKPLEKLLHVGESVNDSIIVLSDIKNFSTIAKAARPDDLNEAMHEYYRTVRELVWKRNGTLDKFIGDAVLAVFNYPNQTKDSSIEAIKFGAELVELGNRVLDELQDKLDEKIETGTRIGMTSGDLWVLNIAKTGVEISFIGDKINLAARLEKNCETNGILISNRLRNIIANTDYDFLNDSEVIKKALEPSEVKGQITNIISWQISPKGVKDILKMQEVKDLTESASVEKTDDDSQIMH